MKKKLSIELNQDVYDRLLSRFQGSEDALISFVIQFLETQAPPKDDLKGLEDYLKSGEAGSRQYGIKGQGW
jgi:hypothetical protein